MKILYLHQYFNTPEMSGGTRSYEMAKRLVQRGHQVEMITSLREPGERRDWFTTVEEGITVHWLPNAYSNHMGFAQRIGAFFRFAIAAARKAASLEGDLVFATSTPLTIALPAVWASRRLSIPMVFEVRDLWPELPIAIGAIKSKPAILAAKKLEKWAYSNSRHVIALSPGMKEGVVKTGFPAERVHVIPNSCDNELFGKENGPEDSNQNLPVDSEWLGNRQLVIYTGTFGKINGAGYLVEIAREMKKLKPDVRFLMVGDGFEGKEIEEKARTLGVLDSNLRILKQIPKRDLVPLLQRATVATSFFINLEEMWANSANKFFDALAAGRPIMINYGGWQARLLEDHGAGIVVPPDNPSKAASMLHELLNDEERLFEASKASKFLALEKFDRDLMAEKLASVLEMAAS